MSQVSNVVSYRVFVDERPAAVECSSRVMKWSMRGNSNVEMSENERVWSFIFGGPDCETEENESSPDQRGTDATGGYSGNESDERVRVLYDAV